MSELIIEFYLFKVKDYTTILVGRYDEEKNCFYIERGDGNRVGEYDNGEFSQIEWSEKIHTYKDNQ